MNDPLFWLYADNYRTYNIDVARKLNSLLAALLLSELASRYRYHFKHNELTSDARYGDNWFYYTQEDIEERTFMTRRQQDSSLEILEKYGFVEKKLIGVPARRHFRLNISKIIEFFFPGVQTSLADSYKLDCTNPPNCIGRNVQTAHYIEEPKEEPQKRSSYAPPAGSAKNCSSSPISKDKKVEKAPSVEVTESEHNKLVITFGKEVTEQGYQELSEWKQSASPAQVKKHSSDYYRLRKWVIPKLQEEKVAASKSRIARHRQGSKLITPGDFEKDDFKHEEW